MDLNQSSYYQKENDKDTLNKKRIKGLIILCAVLLILMFFIILLLNYIDSITLKVFVNNAQIPVPKGLYIVKNEEDPINTTYVSAKALASMIGYKYSNGEYGEYNEDINSCYLENDFEVVAFTAGEGTYTKYISNTKPTAWNDVQISTKNSSGYSETFRIEKPVIQENDSIYIPLEYLEEMFSIKVTWQEYRKRFRTTDNLFLEARNIASREKIPEISGYYENMRTLNYGYAVVGDGKGQYAIINLSNKEEVVGFKYSEIVFMQNTKEFYVKTSTGAIGIINMEGKNIVTPKEEYEKIMLLDEEQRLYYVQQNGLWGVIDGKNDESKIVLYPEFDSIGVDSKSFKIQKKLNGGLLFGKCIPVEKDGKFGLYDIYGDILLDCIYERFGFVSNGKVNILNEQSILVIPSSVGINGIIINYNNQNGNEYYGIYDVNINKIVVPCSASKIFASTKSGETVYYMEYNNEQIDLKEWLKERNLNNVDEETGEFIENISNKVEEDVLQENVQDIEE